MIQSRVLKLYLTYIALFGILAVRLCYLSAADSEVNIGANYSQNVALASRRGYIYDRNGEALAGVGDGWLTVVDPTKLDLYSADGETLSARAGLDRAKLLEIKKTYKLYRVVGEAPADTSCSISFPLYKRWGESSAAAHIVGYVNSDGRGVSGIERAYNALLEQTSGRLSVSYQSDAASRLFGGLPVIFSDSGYSGVGGVTLTLDAELQRSIETLPVERGAVLVVDCEDCELLASASFPPYLPDNVASYLDSSEGELINRAFTGFTPGSLFKLVTACAALEASSEYLHYTYDCDGTNCYAGIPHGEVDMRSAFAQSCNAYFIALGKQLGGGALEEAAEKLGVGGFTRLGLLASGGGRVDTSVLSNASIGQGGTLVTPLEAAGMITTVINGGVRRDIRLVRSARLSDGTEIGFERSEGTRVISMETAGLLRELMLGVVRSGTGKAALPSDAAELGVVTVGGKTASAQSGQYYTDEAGKRRERIHSWFLGFVELDGRVCAVTVLLEGAESGAAAVFAEAARMTASSLAERLE